MGFFVGLVGLVFDELRWFLPMLKVRLLKETSVEDKSNLLHFVFLSWGFL